MMLRRLAIAVAILLSAAAGALLARGCYPGRPLPSSVSTAPPETAADLDQPSEAAPPVAVVVAPAVRLSESAVRLRKVGETLVHHLATADADEVSDAKLRAHIVEAAKKFQELDDALRSAKDSDPGVAEARRALNTPKPGSARAALAQVSKSVRAGKTARHRGAAYRAAKRFLRAVNTASAALAAAASASADLGATNPAVSVVFDSDKVRPKSRKRRRSPKAAPKPPAAAKGPPGPVRPEIKVHTELIPKNIRIVRVYYANTLAAPGGTIDFDINGSGFTAEFHKQLSVQSGMEGVGVRDFSLVTPNQIHGRLTIGPRTATAFAFPTVSIGNKVVFQAADPYAVIRPGEVLNLVFTEMGESGRSGRFRVFTNLDEKSFKRFRVVPSTPAIALGDLVPRLPFVVDGSISVGPAVTGEYGVKIFLGSKLLWERDGVIRIVAPNVGQTGLVLRLQADDGFHRPGDAARFLVQGSGFQGSDAASLWAEVPGIDGESFAFTYLAPGRMSLDIKLPASAAEGSYAVSIRNGDKVLLDTPNAFRIVPANWLRRIAVTPPLKPGGSGELVLQGRSLDRSFVQELRVAVDEPGLKIGKFKWVSAIQATAPISAAATVNPGDYQVRIRHRKERVVPESGDIIRVVR